MYYVVRFLVDSTESSVSDDLVESITYLVFHVLSQRMTGYLSPTALIDCSYFSAARQHIKDISELIFSSVNSYYMCITL